VRVKDGIGANEIASKAAKLIARCQESDVFHSFWLVEFQKLSPSNIEQLGGKTWTAISERLLKPIWEQVPKKG
jgi:hypothetical protein